MIIKNNYLRVLYNFTKWLAYPFCVGMMIGTIFPNQPVEMIVVCIIFCILDSWHNSRNALSE